MYPLKQSTAITVPFFAHDVSGDGVTGMTDGGFTKRISKNGGAFGAMTVTITEMENGWYSFPLSTSHSDTLGILSISFSNASCKRVNLQFRVHARIPDDLATSSALATVQADTDNIQTRLPAALVGGKMDSVADVTAISGDGPAADNLETMLDGTGGQALTATFTGNLTGSVNSVTTQVTADVTSISGDTPAADSLEAILDGTGAVMTLTQLRINSSAAGGAIDIDNSGGPAIAATTASAGQHALTLVGSGSGSGINAQGGATGSGANFIGGGTSGPGAIFIAPSSGDGISASGAGGGYDINGDIQGNLSGSVASVTNAVTVGAMNATALADFFNVNSLETYGSSVAGSVVKEIADNAGGAALTEAGIADAVWNEDIVADHGTADTAGLILSQLTKRTGLTFSTEVADTSIIGQMVDDGTAVFDRTTDSLQAIKDSGVGVDVTAISGDSAAADALEAILDGTGAVMTLSQLRINSSAAGGAIDIDNSVGGGIDITTSGTNQIGVSIIGSGTMPGLYCYSTGLGAGMRLDSVGGPGLSAGGNPNISGNINGTIATVIDVTNPVTADITSISGDSGAADSLEAILDGTGATMTLDLLRINGARAAGVVDIDNSAGPCVAMFGLNPGFGCVDIENSNGHGVRIASSGGNGDGIKATGNGSGAGILATSGATGYAIEASGNQCGLYCESTSGVGGNGIQAVGSGVSGQGMALGGAGTGSGLLSSGGATGAGGEFRGGATSGHGLYCRAFTSGNGLQIEGAGSGDSLNSAATDQIEAAILDAAESDHVAAGTVGLAVSRLRKWRTNREKVNPATNRLELYDDNGTSIIQEFDLKDDNGDPTDVAIYERVPV